MEDGERTVRNVRIDVWRRFFARYRMVETGFSESSMYQANLVAKKFACGSFCTIDKNGKCLNCWMEGDPNSFNLCLEVSLRYLYPERTFNCNIFL